MAVEKSCWEKLRRRAAENSCCEELPRRGAEMRGSFAEAEVLFRILVPSQYADHVVRSVDTWGWMDRAWAVATEAPFLFVDRFVIDGREQVGAEARDDRTGWTAFCVSSLSLFFLPLEPCLEAMVTPAEMLTILECVGAFLFDYRRHSDLVPLLAIHSALGPVAVRLQDHLENTIRLALRFGGAWAVDNTQVLFHVVGGRAARYAARRGRQQRVDVRLLAELEYLPWEVLATMEMARTRVRTAWRERGYVTSAGFLHVEEMEARIRYQGGQYLYWSLQLQTLHPTEWTISDEMSSSSDTDSWI